MATAASTATPPDVSTLPSMFEGIKWEERIPDAPWYQTKQKVHGVGGCFLVTGLALGAFTELTRRQFTAGLIKEVYSLATVAFFFMSVGIAFLAQRTFKNDPDYLRSEGKKAVEDLKTNDRSHKFITENYGRFFTKANINQYLKVQIDKATNYDAFITFHGKQVLNDLNEENGELVQELFIQQFVNNAQETDQIQQSYGEECLKFPGIITKIDERRTAAPISADAAPLMEGTDTSREVAKDHADVGEPPLERPMLGKEIDRLLNKEISYQTFMDLNGSGAIISFIKQLIDPFKSQYIENLKAYFKMLDFPEMKLFYLQNKKALHLKPDDFNQCLSDHIHRATSYDEFISRHKKEVLEALDPKNSEQLEKLFIQHALKAGLGVVEVQKCYPEECVKFPQVLTEVYQASTPSRQKDTLTSASQEDRERYFRPAFLLYVATLGRNIGSIQREFAEECQLLSVDESLLKQQLLVKEVDKLLDKKITYEEFIKDHGSDAISLFIKGLVDPKPYIEKLQEYFETLPYPVMNLFFSHNEKALELTLEMQRSGLSTDVLLRSNYGSVRRKHGSDKTVIKEIHESSKIPYLKFKFQAWIKEAAFHELPEYKDDFDLFELPYPQARRTQLLRELNNPQKPLTFESLIDKYGYEIFDEQLVDLNHPIIAILLRNYLLTNSEDFFLGKYNLYRSEMLVHRLISSNSVIGDLIIKTQKQLEDAELVYQQQANLVHTPKKVEKETIRSLISQHMELGIKTLAFLVQSIKTQISRGKQKIQGKLEAQKETVELKVPVASAPIDTQNMQGEITEENKKEGLPEFQTRQRKTSELEDNAQILNYLLSQQSQTAQLFEIKAKSDIEQLEKLLQELQDKLQLKMIAWEDFKEQTDLNLQNELKELENKLEEIESDNKILINTAEHTFRYSQKLILDRFQDFISQIDFS